MKRFILIGLVFLLFYTRFVNLGWGLPYPMHPDERNMAVAVQGMNCNFKFQISNFEFDSVKNCLNPHFFAYGQFPLILAAAGIYIYHFIFGISSQPTFVESTLALRTISALSSIFLVFVLLKIAELIMRQCKRPLTFDFRPWTLLFFIFQPYSIQFSHFGTTESLLMLLYSLIIYFSLKLLLTFDFGLSTKYLLLAGTFSGLALGTKTSSILFLGVPLMILIVKVIYSFFAIGNWEEGRDRIYREVLNIFFYVLISSFFFILSSPHSLLNWTDFTSSMNYESSIGLGTYIAFYTRQFIGTTPIQFQFQHILPYVLGWPQLIIGMLGFILLPWINSKQYAKASGPLHPDELRARSGVSRVQRRHRWHLRELVYSICNNPYNILRFALLLSFIPPSFFFAKWTRFIAPSFPLFSLFAILSLIWLISKIKNQISKLQSKNKIFNFNFLNFILIFAFCISILPGIAFLSVYTSPDVRFTASEWIYKNIPAGSKILSETANVIDLPILTNSYSLAPARLRSIPSYQINSFNFYDLDESADLQSALSNALKQADYIIVPSRRVFANHTCLSPKPESINVLKLDICDSQNYALRTTNYELLNKYYSYLFSGSLGFEQVAEFSSYPRFEFSILGSTFRVPFTDERAEETWTVFDHPVIRIYKKIQAPNSNSKFPSTGSGQAKLKSKELDFSNYQTINYELRTTNYELLVADSPEKWERGLMYVRNKQDIGGLDGMIFIFPDSQKRTFWNKNTLSNLTLYWINNNTVTGVSDLPSITKSGQITTVSSPSPADTVIEIIKE